MTQVIDIIVKGGIVMIPLLACSLISLTLTIERLFLGKDQVPASRAEHARAGRSRANSTKLSKSARIRRIPSPACWPPAWRTAIPRRPRPWKPRPRRRFPLLKSRLGTLDTIITLAPLLGLLGTVVGMIGSFDIMSEAGMGQPHAITGGVAEALIATATGLLIAILTLIPYNYFSSRVEKEMDAMEHFSSSLELLLHEHAGKH